MRANRRSVQVSIDDAFDNLAFPARLANHLLQGEIDPTRVVDYLLKPVRPERLHRSLERVRQQLAAIREEPFAMKAPEPPGEPRRISRLMRRTMTASSSPRAIRWTGSSRPATTSSSRPATRGTSPRDDERARAGPAARRFRTPEPLADRERRSHRRAGLPGIGQLRRRVAGREEGERDRRPARAGAAAALRLVSVTTERRRAPALPPPPGAARNGDAAGPGEESADGHGDPSPCRRRADPHREAHPILLLMPLRPVPPLTGRHLPADGPQAEVREEAFTTRACRWPAPRWIVGLALVALAATPARGAVGDLDLSFGGTGIVIAPALPTPALASGRAILIDDHDRILLVGFTYVPGGADVALLRFLPDGTPDAAFGTNGTAVVSLSPGVDFVTAARFDTQGRIVVAAYSSAVQGTDLSIVRFLPSGVLDTSFSNDGWNSAPLGTEQEFAADLVIDDAGRIVIVGSTLEGDGYSDLLLTRFTDDGRLDETFGNGGLVRTDVRGGADGAGGVAIDPSGRIVLAGYACASSCSMAVLRYRADGTLDPTFGDGGVVTSNPGTASSGASAVVPTHSAASPSPAVRRACRASRSSSRAISTTVFPTGRSRATGSRPGASAPTPPGIALAVDDAGRILVTGSAGRSSSTAAWS